MIMKVPVSLLGLSTEIIEDAFPDPHTNRIDVPEEVLNWFIEILEATETIEGVSVAAELRGIVAHEKEKK